FFALCRRHPGGLVGRDRPARPLPIELSTRFLQVVLQVRLAATKCFQLLVAAEGFQGLPQPRGLGLGPRPLGSKALLLLAELLLCTGEGPLQGFPVALCARQSLLGLARGVAAGLDLLVSCGQVLPQLLLNLAEGFRLGTQQLVTPL